MRRSLRTQQARFVGPHKDHEGSMGNIHRSRAAAVQRAHPGGVFASLLLRYKAVELRSRGGQLNHERLVVACQVMSARCCHRETR